MDRVAGSRHGVSSESLGLPAAGALALGLDLPPERRRRMASAVVGMTAASRIAPRGLDL